MVLGIVACVDVSRRCRGMGWTSWAAFRAYLCIISIPRPVRGVTLPPTMTSLSLSAVQPPPGTRVPMHPIECLRIVELPKCTVCTGPTTFYCGGCWARPAFCSADHFIAVRRARIG